MKSWLTFFTLASIACASEPRVDVARCQESLRAVAQHADSQAYDSLFDAAMTRELGKLFIAGVADIMENFAGRMRDSSGKTYQEPDSAKLIQAICREFDGLTAEQISRRATTQ